jgi:hypothetical protein
MAVHVRRALLPLHTVCMPCMPALVLLAGWLLFLAGSLPMGSLQKQVTVGAWSRYLIQAVLAAGRSALTARNGRYWLRATAKACFVARPAKLALYCTAITRHHSAIRYFCAGLSLQGIHGTVTVGQSVHNWCGRCAYMITPFDVNVVSYGAAT